MEQREYYTTPQLYCTLRRKYVKPKPISRQNQKLTQQHNWKKSSSSPQPTRSECFSSLKTAEKERLIGPTLGMPGRMSRTTKVARIRDYCYLSYKK